MVIGTLFLAGLVGCEARSDITSCHGLVNCGCVAEKGELKYCTKNVNVMYLHNVSNQHPLYTIGRDAFFNLGRLRELHLR